VTKRGRSLRCQPINALLTIVVGLFGVLVGYLTAASASITSSAVSLSAIVTAAPLKTHVGVALLPAPMFVRLRSPGSPAGIGEIGCG
jgi:hypothetical protein